MVRMTARCHRSTSVLFIPVLLSGHLSGLLLWFLVGLNVGFDLAFGHEGTQAAGFALLQGDTAPGFQLDEVRQHSGTPDKTGFSDLALAGTKAMFGMVDSDKGEDMLGGLVAWGHEVRQPAF